MIDRKLLFGRVKKKADKPDPAPSSYLPPARNQPQNTKTNDVASELDDKVSIIGQHRKDLIRRLERGENLDGVALDLTNITLRAIVDIMPEVELAAKTSSRGVYPLVNLTNLLRELSHDLRSMQDRNAMRDRIMNEVLDPALLRFAQIHLIELNKLKAHVKSEDGLIMIDALRMSVSTTVNDMHVRVSNALDKYFGGSGGATNIIHEDEKVDVYSPDDGKMFERM